MIKNLKSKEFKFDLWLKITQDYYDQILEKGVKWEIGDKDVGLHGSPKLLPLFLMLAKYSEGKRMTCLLQGVGMGPVIRKTCRRGESEIEKLRIVFTIYSKSFIFKQKQYRSLFGLIAHKTCSLYLNSESCSW